MMEHSLLKELQLEGESYPLCLECTSDHQREETNSVMLVLEISRVHDSNTHWIPKVHTVNSLSLPRQSLAMEELSQKYQHLKGLPTDSYCNVQPRVLIRMDNCRLGHALDSREGRDSEPIATRTRLGWIVFGPYSIAARAVTDFTGHHSVHLCQCSEQKDAELHKADDERAEQLLKTLTLLKKKRYETGLLWRYDDVRLPDSKSMAMRRLLCLEKRMQREPEMAEELKEKIRNYVRSGYAEKLTESQLAEHFPRVWYLPIFPVVNPNKPGKLRIVWDAAAKVAGTSLNCFLLTGPDQLTSLPSVLRRFREYSIAVTGDIREMFQQVMVNKIDQQCQRFLWCDGEQDRNPDVYAMKVDNVSVPRYYRMKTSVAQRNVKQLHVFVDASENGFAAVAYLRFEENGTVECALVGAKTRVAPLRFVSIPKLELQAAVIGARLAHDVMETHKLKPAQRFFWSDSRDVLCWINSDHRKYSQFVGARISEMLDLSEPKEWSWISIKLNVADDATKWQKLPDLSPTSRWFCGPDFLWKTRELWLAHTSDFGETIEELRPRFLTSHNQHYFKPIVTGPLTQKELHEAELMILKIVQDAEFASEIDLLKEPKRSPWSTKLPKSSVLYKLSPFMGGDGLLRMKGRIDACEVVEEDTKHPILLPKYHTVTDLIIASVHQRYCHMNHQTALNEIRRKFYVPQLRST
ncbi:uncharacterized protein LOC134209583 [Armigeres subalbatus]|uniref:uncharacterized protein LOC134209583 n=1 Tax=Armigeres subalbatus TaxID=124917 RepID=UPI002ED1B066